MRRTAILVPTILLGAITCAQAQEGPGGRLGGAGGSTPSIEAPGGGGGGGSPSIGGGGGPAEGLGNSGGGEGPRALERGANEGRAERPAGSADDGPAERGPSRKSAGSDSDKAPKARRERSADDSGPSKAEKTEKAAERAKSKAEDKAGDTQKRAGNESDERAKQAREDTPKADDAAKTKDAKANDAAKTNADSAARVTPERAKQVEIAGDKRDRVGSAFRDKRDARHRTKVDIGIGVGRRLPRDWDYVPVPVAVIEIVPEYRDYVYVWVEDEYVICDPDTYEVVAVIPASSSRHASSGGVAECSTRIRLSDDERDLILQEVRMRDAVEVQDLDIGWSVPSNIELQRFPEPVLAEADELSGCRYFVAEDQLAIVDPDADKVVLLIDRS